MTNAICCSQLHRPDSSAAGNLQISEVSRTRLSARANAEISLVTAEGDKITLSASSALRATHITYDYLGRIQGQAVAAHAEKLQISTSSEFAVTLQGELDEAELADIGKLLDAIEAAAADVFSGQSGELPASFAAIGELDSIASFQAALSYSREASAVRAGRITSTGEEPAAGAAETAPSGKPAEPKSAESFIAKLGKAAGRLEDENNIDKLPRRFTRLFKKLAKNLALDEHERELAERIHSEALKRRQTGHHHERA